ncbi:MAG TPA: lytic transglycosylase domain-containing protein [Rhodanobacteraceae bacterium]|nr:lytic transglycosylase domain-containing protein [Rhodanobacteraceae bacterium]
MAVCVLLGLLAWARPGHAEGLYRCAGSSGETVFTSSAEGYHGCKALDVAGQRPISSISATRTVASAVQPPATGRARVLKGAVYRVKRADGSIEYTNVRPAGGRGHATTMLFTYIDTCAACNLHSPVDWTHVRLNLTAYADEVRSAAAEYHVDPALLRAVIHAESAFNPRAMSAKGAQGLMQLMPDTAGELGVHDAFDATQNIRGGAQYLAQLLKDFGGDAKLAAAAYNAGPAAVQKYDGVPPYAETQVYVDRVATLKRRYAAALAVTPTLAAAP